MVMRTYIEVNARLKHDMSDPKLLRMGIVRLYIPFCFESLR